MSAFVLVVDDNEDNLRIIRDILRTRGFEVQLAHDGPTALQSIEERRPDLVLLDLMMPQMDGFEFLERLRANPRHAALPVILVTARSQDDDLLAGYKGSASSWAPARRTDRACDRQTLRLDGALARVALRHLRGHRGLR